MKFGQAIKTFFSNSKLGIATGVVAYAVSWVIKALSIPVVKVGNSFVSVTASTVDINLRNQAVTSGGLNTLGTKFLEYTTGFASKLPTYVGLPAFDLMELLMIVIGGFVLVGFGTVLFNLMGQKGFGWASKIKLNPKLVGILTLGSAFTYLLMAVIGGGLGALQFTLGLLFIPVLVYYVLMTLLLQVVDKYIYKKLI